MSLFGSNQNQDANLQISLQEYNRQAQKQLQAYQQAMLAQQQNIAGSLGALMGVGGGIASNNFGPAGALQRQGLGTAKPVAMLHEEIVVHALVGWRRWSVTMFGEELMSNNGVPWKPYEKLAAACASGAVCRGVECGCGIYSYKQREQAEHGDNAPTNVTHIWGEVWLWGRVIEHERGFRAQFAYPKAFVNTGGIAARMATVYGVKLIEEEK